MKAPDANDEMGPRLLTAREFARKPPKPMQEEIDRAQRERDKHVEETRGEK